MKRHRSNTEEQSDSIAKMAATVARTMAERSTGTKDVLLALAQAVAATGGIQKEYGPVNGQGR